MATVDMFTRFYNNCVQKYGRRFPEIAEDLFSEGRALVRYGGQTSKGMKWLKYYDTETGKLVAYEQAYKGQAKMTKYDIGDAAPVTTLKLGKNGKKYLSGEGTWDKQGMLEHLDYLTNDIRVRKGSIYPEMPTGHVWLG